MICARWFSDYIYWRLTLNLLFTLNAKPTKCLVKAKIYDTKKQRKQSCTYLKFYVLTYQYLNLLNLTEKSNAQEFAWIEVSYNYLATSPPSMIARSIFPTLPLFVCRYKMHWVLCPQGNLRKGFFSRFFLLIIEFVFY